MSFYAMKWAAERQGLKGTAKLVLMMLAYHHNAKTKMTFPSIETLVTETGTSKSTVDRALKALELAGHIKRRRGRWYRAAGVSTRYQLLCDFKASLQPKWMMDGRDAVIDRSNWMAMSKGGKRRDLPFEVTDLASLRQRLSVDKSKK